MGDVVGSLTRSDLTDPETALVDAAMTGTWWAPPSDDPGGDDPAPGKRWGPARTIRAQVLYQLLTDRGYLCFDNKHGEVLTPRAVRVRGARVTGRLDLETATLRCPLPAARCPLPAARCPLRLDACFLDCQESVMLREATAPVVRLTVCRLPFGLDALQLRTTGDLDLGQTRANGEVQLDGAHIGGRLDLGGGTFRNPAGAAISANRLQVDHDLFCGDGFETNGAVQLDGAHIGGLLELTGGTFIDAEVRLAGAHIGGQQNLSGGTFHNPAGDAINADGVQVDQGMFCGEGFEADGAVSLVGAHVGGQLALTGTFRNPDRGAINAEDLSIGGSGVWWPKEVIGKLVLGFARAGVWVDNATGRAAPTVLRGFRYDALHPGPDEVSPDERIAWLEGDPTGYSPQPYTQLASIYRAEGHDRHARMVLVASQNQRRRRGRGWRSWPSLAWSAFLRWTIGYGYRPALALIPLTVLFVAGWAIFDAAHPEQLSPVRKGAPEQPGFSPARYTADLLLPVVTFKQRDAFVSKGWVAWASFGFTFAGWLLAAVVVAGLTGVFKRD